jgi:hypothetical protein
MMDPHPAEGDQVPHPDSPAAQDPRENAIYNLHGRLHIFFQGYLIPVFRATNDTRSSWTDQAELVATPGSELWVSKMVQFRNNLASDLRNANAEVERQQTFHRNLGEAILAIADEREWCEEYDEFASQWNLPTRTREYEVIVRFNVLARSAEEAKENFSLYVEDEHQGGGSPEVSVEECGR